METIQKILWIVAAIAIILVAAAYDDTAEVRKIQLENSLDAVNWQSNK
jgi:hypothetical protein